MLADLYLKLRQSHPQLRLVIAPRHFERGSQIATALRSRSFRWPADPMVRRIGRQPGKTKRRPHSRFDR